MPQIIQTIRSFLRAYLNFRKERRDNGDAIVSYYNFWPRDKYCLQDTWLADFYNHIVPQPQQKRINLVSIFGKKEAIYFINRPRIFFTGENIHTKLINDRFSLIDREYLSKFDLSLGFDDETLYSDINYLRFPLWILYLIPYDATRESIKKMMDGLNDPKHRLNPDRNRFACNISRHDNNGIRQKIIDAVNKVATVTCAGDFLNNTNELREEYADDKLRYLRNFKFNICPENSDAPGYVTEKIFESILAGCVPIYWGSGNNPEPDILNPEAILFYSDENREALTTSIDRLYNDSSKFEAFAHIPPFREDAAEKIWQWLEELKGKISELRR